MLGAGGSVQCRKAWMDGRDWRVPECRRHLHRVYHAGFSRQVHAVYESAARLSFVVGCGSNLWTRDSRLAPLHAVIAEQGALLAKANPWQGAPGPEKISRSWVCAWWCCARA